MTQRRPAKHCTKAAIQRALIDRFPQLSATRGALYGFRLDTKLGPLALHPADCAIRTRFDEVPLAAPVGAPLNPYSGKWNFEGLDDAADVGRALDWIGRLL